jgi:broad specificity phosphatase PhoE
MRAREAAAMLDALAREHERLLVVGHGNFNGLIARELRRLGWKGPHRTASKNWDATVYRR